MLPQVPLYGCDMCFRMLHYDADGKPLTGKAAGEEATESGSVQLDAGGGMAAAQGEGGCHGLRKWRAFPCFDEL